MNRKMSKRNQRVEKERIRVQTTTIKKNSEASGIELWTVDWLCTQRAGAGVVVISRMQSWTNRKKNNKIILLPICVCAKMRPCRSAIYNLYSFELAVAASFFYDDYSDRDDAHK